MNQTIIPSSITIKNSSKPVQLQKINCEPNINFMFEFILIPKIKKLSNPYKCIVWSIVHTTYLLALVSYIYYPEYYINQPEIWTFDLCLSYIIYVILIYLHCTSNLFLFDTNFGSSSLLSKSPPKEAQFYEQIKITPYKHYVSFGFYVLYLCYYLYYSIYMFYSHPEPNVFIQLGNIVMCFAWYLFF